MPTFRDILHFLYQVYDADEYIYIFQICDASPTYMRIIYVYIYIFIGTIELRWWVMHMQEKGWVSNKRKIVANATGWTLNG
jgi:hypothetical protein